MSVSLSSSREAMIVTLRAPLLLCSLGLVSLVGASQVVAVPPGADATLLCANFTSRPTQIYWFRLVEKTQTLHLGWLRRPDELAYYSEDKKDKYKLWSNLSTLFLRISRVDTSDAGLYFCGSHMGPHPVLAGTAYLAVEEEKGGEEYGGTSLLGLILCGVTLALTKFIICLVMRMSRLQTGSGRREDEDAVLCVAG